MWLFTISLSIVTTSSIRSARDPDDLQNCAVHFIHVYEHYTNVR